jgi:hypothetical protein
MHSSVITTSVLLFLTHVGTVLAQSGDKSAPPLPSTSSAFVDVKVVPMNSESVLSGRRSLSSKVESLQWDRSALHRFRPGLR